MRVRQGAPSRTPGIVIVTMFAVIGAGLFALRHFRSQSEQPKPSTALRRSVFRPVAETFAPGVHMLGQLSPSVAYVIETSDGLVLIDTGMESGHRQLLNQFRELGLDINDLKMILITHGHGDHYLGASRLRELTGAKVYAGKGDSDVIRTGGPRDAVFSTFQMHEVEIHPAVVDVELSGGEILESGDLRMRVLATPGHTPGSVCYLMEREDLTVLFSGDTIMTIAGDLGTYATYLAPRYRGDARSYLATLRQLRELPVPSLLLPGHPRTGEMTISPQVSQANWEARLDAGIESMERLVSRYDADGEDFLDGSPKEILPGLHYLGDVFGTAAYCMTDGTHVILLDAPGGSELVGFLRERLPEVGFDLGNVAGVLVTDTSGEPIAGLKELVAATGCGVIAAEGCHDALRQQCPDAELWRADQLVDRYSWLPLQPIAIEGTGQCQSAFAVRWNDRQVLITGDIPLTVTAKTARDYPPLRSDPNEFLSTLGRLEKTDPNVWLSSYPANGRNANVYDSSFRDMIQESRLIIGSWSP